MTAAGPGAADAVRLEVASEAQLTRMAGLIARYLKHHWGPDNTSASLVIYLHGELGAGKTSFSRAFIRQLGFVGRVKSPSYALLEHYLLDPFAVLHLDCYRITDPDEIHYLGLADLMPGAVLLVEWPEMGKGHLPDPDLVVRIQEPDGQPQEGQSDRNARVVHINSSIPITNGVINELRKKSTFSD